MLNLKGVETSARVNEGMAAAMGGVVALFLAFAVKYLTQQKHWNPADFLRRFYDPQSLTYIGFDGISTLSEEVDNPKRNIMLATLLTCLITGILATIEVYASRITGIIQMWTRPSFTWRRAPEGL